MGRQLGKHLTLVHVPRSLFLAGGAHLGNATGWEIGLDAVIGVWKWHRAIILGWGWDADVPLRPWPQAWWQRHTKRGNVTSGLAWLGLFVNVGRVP